MNPLIAWVKAREELRLKKESGAPPPWTDDPILQQYRFTNVRRRHDRVSRWLLSEVLELWFPVGTRINPQRLDNFLLFTALCRWVNWPPTIAAIMEKGLWGETKPIDWLKVGKFIDARTKDQKVWTGAYMIRAPKAGSNKGKGVFIATTVVRDGLRPVLPQIKEAFKTKSRRAVWEVLTSRNYWGPFMAGQLVDDWSWTPLLADATDTFTWAPQGPGSLRGFNRLLGLPLKTKHSEEEWCRQLIVWRQEIIDELGPAYDDVSLADVQNVCCEYSKYAKVLEGSGRPRSKYRPEEAF